MKVKVFILVCLLTLGIASGCTSAQITNAEADLNTAALILQQGLVDYENNKATIDDIASKTLALALKTKATHNAATNLVGLVQKLQDPAALAQAKAEVAKIISHTTSTK